MPNLYGVERGCDERTLALIKTAVDSRRPILGICRGSQLLNVAYGGTLIPDLGDDGVQWHPEDSDGSEFSRQALFGALLRQAAAHQSS